MGKSTEPKRKKAGGRGKGVGSPKSKPGCVPIREARFLENRFVKGMSLSDATIAAGYRCGSKNSAASLGAALAKKHRENPNSPFRKALIEAGVTTGHIAQKIAEGLEATAMTRSGRDDAEEVADHGTRHKFIETALDITGARAPKKPEVETKTFEQRLMQIVLEDQQTSK